MDLIDRIDELQVLIEEAKAVPLSSSAVIDRTELLDLLAQLKQEVPEEVRQARWMARDRDELMERARNEGERIVAEAREQRDRLLSRTEIVHGAQREAERIIDEAKSKATKLEMQADDYMDQKLAAFEILLNKTLGTVSKGREQLRNAKSKGDPGVPQNGETITANTGPFDAADLRQPTF